MGDGVLEEPDDVLLCGHLKNLESLCNLNKLMAQSTQVQMQRIV